MTLNQDQARRWAEEVELPEPFGYVREWQGDDSDLGNWLFETDKAELDDEIWGTVYTESQVREAIATALVKLTQGQEPVAWRWKNRHGEIVTNWLEFKKSEDAYIRQQVDEAGGTIEYAYTHPIPSQQEDRKPLTEDDVFKSVKIISVNGEYLGQPMSVLMRIVRAVEEASREKNTGQPVVKEN